MERCVPMPQGRIDSEQHGQSNKKHVHGMGDEWTRCMQDNDYQHDNKSGHASIIRFGEGRLRGNWVV